MSLLMLLLARAYAPLGARGALVDGMRSREAVASAGRHLRPALSACTPFCTPLPVQVRHLAGAVHAQDDGESLAA
jgi:hypothetical protein